MIQLPIITALSAGVNKVIPDATEKKKQEVKAFIAQMENQVHALTRELNGNRLQRAWRPILMLGITTILVHNYLIYPYLVITFKLPVDLFLFPDHLWDLLKIGVGGYVAVAGVEKGVKAWNKPKATNARKGER